MKTLIAINNLLAIDQLAYSSHMTFFYSLGRRCPECDFGICNPRRYSIDRMRNFAAAAAIEHNFDYLMFIDDDVLVPWDAWRELQKADKDIVAGVTLIRGYPYHPMIFNFTKNLLADTRESHYVDNYKELADPETGLLECDAVGFSCCLIKVSLLAKMTPPYFVTGINCTEDVYFCSMAKRQFPNTTIFAQTKIETGHILGSDFISPSNLDDRKKFDECIDPGLGERVRVADSRQEIIVPNRLKVLPADQQLKAEFFNKGKEDAPSVILN